MEERRKQKEVGRKGREDGERDGERNTLTIGAHMKKLLRASYMYQTSCT